MSVDPNSTSYPTIAAAQAFGVPEGLAQSFGWGIVLASRGERPGYWENRAAEELMDLLGLDRLTDLHDQLSDAYYRNGVMRPKEDS